jgi:hypothetical protein
MRVYATLARAFSERRERERQKFQARSPIPARRDDRQRSYVHLRSEDSTSFFGGRRWTSDVGWGIVGRFGPRRQPSSNFGSREIGAPEEARSGGSKVRVEAHQRARVVHQSCCSRRQVDTGVDGDPHRNWENSAGLLVERAHGHLSCRDRPAYRRLGPIRVNAREIARRPFGKISRVRSPRVCPTSARAGAVIDTRRHRGFPVP